MKRPSDDLAADRERALTLTPVSRETAARLDTFVALLQQWQAKTNLVAPSTLSQLWTRHIADSLQLIALAPSAKAWADLGSGGGFPGIIIGTVLADSAGRIHLVESNAKKAAFLREAARITAIPAVVHNQRAENFAQHFSGEVDIVTARALAPLKELLGYVAPLVKRGAQALLLKGQDVEAELTEASKYWRIKANLAPSVTDPDARIVIVRELERSS